MRFYKYLIVFVLVYHEALYAQPQTQHNLQFDRLSTVWDEAIPLGNGMVGALVWQKEGRLRFSLDRADIWDQRPMKGLHREEFNFKWVQEQVAKKDYKPVQDYLDAPYDREPAPSKIPAGAIEFSIPEAGEVESVNLHLATALSTVKWKGGLILQTFVHATEPVGWFKFQNLKGEFTPELIAPRYQGDVDTSGTINSLVGNDLRRLGYKQGVIKKIPGSITYTQEGYGGFRYDITVSWKSLGKGQVEGLWSVSSHFPDRPATATSNQWSDKALARGYLQDWNSHQAWWKDFWAQSAIQVPDPLLEKQWYLEQYKFGSAARAGAPPISLQAVWTADNGRIPPWKGDFHHDLNTQLSYWPAYSGNHLKEAMGYLDHLDQNSENYKRYTQRYFGVEGLAVPGVTTLDGTEMGGWIQYALSPTVSSWLSQHYYLQWRYSMDAGFLKKRAYPWVRQVCTFIENITSLDEDGLRQLPISSSPEINDNKLEAWFPKNTNYDLALMKAALGYGHLMALELGMAQEAAHWKDLQNEFGDYSLTEKKELKFAQDLDYNVSHRHFSHLMAFHPLGLINWEDGPESQKIITNTLAKLDAVGPDYWTGYSYAWLGNLKARAKDGAGAAKALRTFAEAFCLPNSFHANGDQSKSGLSKMTYRPFTLEGNFAFAAGIQEMLLQSYAGYIHILPAIPETWGTVSFQNLRAEGAFLVDAKMEGGVLSEVGVRAEKAGVAMLKLNPEEWKLHAAQGVRQQSTEEGFLELNFKAGGSAQLVRK
ncbi:glycosyl hydrolase family 95 catalytic domain-containing protein [Dyadobacter tibetensis]|uniref:glycosyl hydrolase family 95 catalytic domain-containing protein n=1 Tax=Dyadobacter tibetensis TaxID=1211851 RepID=UPI00047093A8|nr:glycoside hydrolase N-terminal domain-containing protein [Dyadobacter tibetensis]